MRVLNVAAKDVFFTLEMSLREIMMIKRALEKCTLDVDKNHPGEVEAAEYLTSEFYPFLEDVAKQGEEHAT